MKKFHLYSLLAIVSVLPAGCERKSADVPSAPEQQTQVEQQMQPQQTGVAQQAPDTGAPPAANPDSAQRVRPRTKESRVTYEPEQGNYEVFYNDLEPDGDWIQTDSYGYVWHPRVAAGDPKWHPYEYGHWVYTESGWAWVSDERFGWATYHYGRWTQLRRIGWVWVPGTQWAPAWVSWRNGNDYVGWAPLPPEARVDRDRHDLGRNVDAEFRIGAGNYVFVQVEQFRAPRMKDVVVDRSQNISLISQTTNITNITNTNTIVVNKNNREERPAVINQGPQADMIAARTKVPVQKLRLTNEQPAVRKTLVNGDRLEIAAPALSMSPGTAPGVPRHVKEHVTNAAEPTAPAASAGQPTAVVSAPPTRSRPSQPTTLKSQPALTPQATPEPKATPLQTAPAEPKTTPVHTTTPEPKAAPLQTAPAEPKATPLQTAPPEPKTMPVHAARPEPRATPESKATTTPGATPVNVPHTPPATDKPGVPLAPTGEGAKKTQPPPKQLPPGAATPTPVPSPN